MKNALKLFVVGCAAAVLLPVAAVPAGAAPGGLGRKSEWTQAAKPEQRRLAAFIPDAIPTNGYCQRSLSRLDLFRGSSKFDWPSTLTVLGETTPVDINNLDLFVGPYTDPSRRLWFRSLLWLAWRAALFAERGQSGEATTAARALVKAVNGYPDPGSSTPELLALSNLAGWDEGTVMRRAEALLCVTGVVGVQEVAPALRAHAAVLLDPNRYVGPPQRPVHNHGLLANLTLLDIADVLGDTAMRDAAVFRLSTEYPQAFSAEGWAYESSAHYQGVNYLGWTDAMFSLQRRGFTAPAAGLQASLQRAATVSAHLIGPTGTPVMIGNSRGDDAFLRPKIDPARPLTVVDPAAGLALGRFSWSDPNTTSWSAMNRPRRGAHGHDDRLSVTWESGGTPILVDPGQPDYELSDPLTAWSKSAAAHNTSIPSLTKKDRSKVATMDVQRTGNTDAITMTSSHSGYIQRREVMIDNQRRSMWVSDEARSSQTQNWHFAPGWIVQGIDGDTATLAGPRGRTLTVTTTKGARITAYSGSQQPLAGWYANGFEQSIPATQLSITGASALDTLFVLGNGEAPADVRILKSTVARSRKVDLQWSAPVEPKADKAKKGSARASSPRAVTVKGYRVQIKVDGGPWKTVVTDSKSADPSAVLRGLDNGTAYRFRVAALTKTTQTRFSRPSRKQVPFTRPGPVAITAAQSAGTTAKPKASLTWAQPARDGGAPVTGYEIKVEASKTPAGRKPRPTAKWKPTRTPGATIRLDGRKSMVSIRAVNKGGSGKELRLELRRRKDGVLLVNGKEIIPVVPPTPTPSPTPAPEPPEVPETPDPDSGAPVTAAG